jgi:hypothetical protein
MSVTRHSYALFPSYLIRFRCAVADVGASSLRAMAVSMRAAHVLPVSAGTGASTADRLRPANQRIWSVAHHRMERPQASCLKLRLAFPDETNSWCALEVFSGNWAVVRPIRAILISQAKAIEGKSVGLARQFVLTLIQGTSFSDVQLPSHSSNFFALASDMTSGISAQGLISVDVIS